MKQNSLNCGTLQHNNIFTSPNLNLVNGYIGNSSVWSLLDFTSCEFVAWIFREQLKCY